MSAAADVSVYYNTGPKTLQVSYLADGAPYNLTGLTPKLVLGTTLADLDLGDAAPVTITGSISGSASGGVALFSLTAAHTVTLGIGRIYAQAQAGDGSTVLHKAAPFAVDILRGVQNLPPDES